MPAARLQHAEALVLVHAPGCEHGLLAHHALAGGELALARLLGRDSDADSNDANEDHSLASALSDDEDDDDDDDNNNEKLKR